MAPRSLVSDRGPSAWVHDFARESSAKVASAFPTAKPVWSPDGTRVAFGANHKGHFDIYSALANGVGPDALVLKSPAAKYPQSWSTDGRWLLYTGVDPVTKEDLWVVPMSGTTAGTPEPFVATNSRDGCLVFAGRPLRGLRFRRERHERCLRAHLPPVERWQVGGLEWRRLPAALAQRRQGAALCVRPSAVDIGRDAYRPRRPSRTAHLACSFPRPFTAAD